MAENTANNEQALAAWPKGFMWNEGAEGAPNACLIFGYRDEVADIQAALDSLYRKQTQPWTWTMEGRVITVRVQNAAKTVHRYSVTLNGDGT